MRNIWTVTRREVGSMFLSPIAWVIMTVFLAIFGVLFSVGLMFGSQAGIESIFMPLPFVMAFAIPMLTMRQFAEERRSGTIETLCTAPVTDAQLVIGKFLGGITLYVVILLPTLSYVWLLFHFSSVGPDKWILASSYLGMLLMGMFMFSFGLFMSAITREQIMAAVVGALGLFSMLLLGAFLPPNAPRALVDDFWSRVGLGLYEVGALLAFTRHFMPFGRGIVDTREIAFFLSATLFFLFLAVAAVGTRKWR